MIMTYTTEECMNVLDVSRYLSNESSQSVWTFSQAAVMQSDAMEVGRWFRGALSSELVHVWTPKVRTRSGLTTYLLLNGVLMGRPPS